MTAGRRHRSAQLAGLLAGTLAAAAVPARAEPEIYTLEPEHSWVQFELHHFGTSTIRGRFGPAAGRVVLDREARRGEVSVTMATGTLSTGTSVFDARIRASDLLATNEYPTAWFVARDLRFEGDMLAEVRGEFTLRGTSRTMSLHAERFGCYESERFRREVCGGDFVGEFRRSDFGMSFGLPFVGDAVTLRVQVEAVRDPS